jgi:propionate CoA-transferase
VLGLAQADAEGNVNVSKFGSRLAGAGGFINISQSARKVVFVGSFCAGDAEVAVESGGLRVMRDATARKFVAQVEHRTFAGRYAAARGQEVLYVTERCVFRLHPQGLELIEVAPGIDMQRDILDRMDFAPIVSEVGEVRTMDARLFLDQPMGLRDRLVGMPFDARFRFDAGRNTLFINFERYEVRTAKTIDAIARKIDSICGPVGRRVHAVANYEGFVIDPRLEDAWTHSAEQTGQRWYVGITRYATSAFLRAKLGAALARRRLSPLVFETEEEACAALSGSGAMTTP